MEKSVISQIVFLETSIYLLYTENNLEIFFEKFWNNGFENDFWNKFYSEIASKLYK